MPRSEEEQQPGGQEGGQIEQGGIGGFGELTNLAETVAQEETARKAEEQNAGETAQLEARIKEEEAKEAERLEATRIGREELARREKMAQDTGRWSYFHLSQQPDRLAEEKAPGMFDGRNIGRSQYVNFGPNGTWKLENPVSSPDDYLTAFDQADRFADKNIAEKSGDPQDLDKLYEEKKNHSLFTRRDETGVSWAVAPEDLPRDIALKLMNQSWMVPGRNEAPHWQAYRERLKQGLGGFAKAALDSGDIVTALKAYKKLGQLDNSDLVARTKQTIEQLRSSQDAHSRELLNRIIGTIKEVR